MATSFLGIGAGGDFSEIYNQLELLANRPLNLLQQKEQSYQAKLTAFGTLKSTLEAFGTAAGKLSKPEFFGASSIKSSDDKILTAGLTTVDTSAPAGSYVIDIYQLAKAHTLAANTSIPNPKTPVGGGTIQIQFGSSSSGSFIPDPDRPGSTVTIDPANSSLENIRDAINNDPNMGVNASIIPVGRDAYKLVLTSKETGETSEMQITATDAGTTTPGLSNLFSTTNMVEQVAAQDAILTVNGVEMHSASNTVKEAIPGVTLNLLTAGTGSPPPATNGAPATATVNIKHDSSNIITALKALIDNYNKVNSTIKDLSSYDAKTQSGQPLMSDPAVNTIKSTLKNILNTQVGGLSLTDLGITLDFNQGNDKNAGNLKLDEKKLQKVLEERPDDVARLFSATNGIGKQFDTFITDINKTSGLLASATKGIDNSLKSLEKSMTATELRIEKQMQTYKNQFTNLDVLMSKMNSQAQTLTSLFG